MENILTTITKKKKLKRIFLMGISLLLSAVLYNVFLLPLNLVTGGTNGIATITNYVYDINPAFMILLLSVACAIFSLMYLGIKRTIGTLIASIVYPLLVHLTSPLNNIMGNEPVDVLLMVLFAGVISGIANGLMYKTGYSNGGFPVVSQVLFEKKHISVAKSSLVINVSIVLVGALFFGTTNALYAIIFLYINNIVLDRVLLGINNNKAFYIITKEEEKVEEYIMEELGHGVTIFPVKGGYTNENQKMLMCVIPTREYYKLKEGISKIDEESFFVITDSYEVKGGA